MFFKALAASLLTSTVLGHFTLDYPTSRGFSDEMEPNFCGGFNDVEARQPFPLGAGPIFIDSHHPKATVDAFLSVSESPSSFNDFNTTSNGTSIPMVTNFFQVVNGEFCWNVTLGDLGIGLTNGSLVTLQIQYNGGDGNLYQCTDLILLSDYQVPSDRVCTVDATTNPSGTVSFAGATSSASGSGASAATSSASHTGAGAASSSGAASGARQTAGWGLVGTLAGLIGVSVL